MNTKLHVLFISNWFPNKHNRFSGDFVQRHAKAVATLHKVTVLHVVGDTNISKIEVEKNRVDDNYNEIIIYFPKSKYKPLNFFKKWKALNYGRRLIEKKVDLIHTNVIHFHFLWLLLQKEKYIHTEHSSRYLPENIDKLSFFRKKISQKVLGRASFITTVSNSLAKGLNSILDLSSIEIIPNVVDTELFFPQQKISNKPTFLHISNLATVKNIQGILETVHIVSEKGYNFNFRIGGNGNAHEIHNFIKRNNLQDKVTILSAMKHEKVVEEMQQADCFLLFSKYENQPCVIIEAFSCGLPVIASDVGGVAENFPKGFGVLIEKNNIEQLVNAMIGVIEGKQFSNHNTMHKYVENNFSTQVIAQKFSNIYKKVLN